MPIAIQAHPEGATLAIRAQPGAKKNAIGGEQGGALKVAVSAPPEDGRANEAILDLLRETFQLKRSRLEILKGQANRNKIVLIRGITPAALTALIAVVS